MSAAAAAAAAAAIPSRGLGTWHARVLPTGRQAQHGGGAAWAWAPWARPGDVPCSLSRNSPWGLKTWLYSCSVQRMMGAGKQSTAGRSWDCGSAR
jgi:hypothetical protein